MSSYEVKPDELAFPFEGGDNNGYNPSSGLSIREYFAAKALQGILASDCYEPPRRNKIKGMAEDAVNAADALIEALNAK